MFNCHLNHSLQSQSTEKMRNYKPQRQPSIESDNGSLASNLSEINDGGANKDAHVCSITDTPSDDNTISTALCDPDPLLLSSGEEGTRNHISTQTRPESRVIPHTVYRKKHQPLHRSHSLNESLASIIKTLPRYPQSNSQEIASTSGDLYGVSSTPSQAKRFSFKRSNSLPISFFRLKHKLPKLKNLIHVREASARSGDSTNNDESDHSSDTSRYSNKSTTEIWIPSCVGFSPSMEVYIFERY